MTDDRGIIARLEEADADELAEILLRAGRSEQSELSVHLGKERFHRMRSLALQRPRTRSATTAVWGNVVVLHGFLGSSLTAYDRPEGDEQIWIDVRRIGLGQLSLLRLGPDGRSPYQPGAAIRAVGLMKRTYGEQLLALTKNWTVRAFPFDWRRDVDSAADELNSQLNDWFAADDPVHLIAHGMGGLVARAFIRKYPARWRSMWDEKGAGKRGGRLIMLGTPNHGSFAIPQTIVGIEPIVKKLAVLDRRNDLNDLLTIINSFVGIYQMLPSPLVLPAMERLYLAETYGNLGVPQVSQAHLSAALQQHKHLAGVVDPDRMINVLGTDQPTFSNITRFEGLKEVASYGVTPLGDGRVTHQLAQLTGVTDYFVDDDSGDLPSNGRVIAALDDLLSTGKTGRLRVGSPAIRSRWSSKSEREARDRLMQEVGTHQTKLGSLLDYSRAWRTTMARPTTIEDRPTTRRRPGDRGGPGSGEPDDAFAEEPEIVEVLTHGVLASRGGPKVDFANPRSTSEPPTIEFQIFGGSIDELDQVNTAGKAGTSERSLAEVRQIEAQGSVPECPIDVIAVGHYERTRPEGTELVLDRAISGVAPGRPDDPRDRSSDSNLILTLFAERGTIRGELGQVFLLPDPRCSSPRGAAARRDRDIAVVGMGVPGRFGAPELKVLARELCWTVGRMGKRHLATVLIGAGVGNIDAGEAASAWIAGIKNALTGSTLDDGRRLRRVTFVERDPDKIEAIEAAIKNEQEQLGNRGRLTIDFEELPPERIKRIRRWWTATKQHEEEKRVGLLSNDPSRLPPTWLTVTVGKEGYRYGAITDTAAIPEHEVRLNVERIRKANDNLAAAPVLDAQLEHGLYLKKLALPRDFTGHLATAAPLVLMLDAATARVHWEMMAQPDPFDSSDAFDVQGDDVGGGAGDGYAEETIERFLGITRGVTRQLRTTFAPPPDPPPPPRRRLRVLIVADPAEDDPLEGAQEEGAAVAALFEQFNALHGAFGDSEPNGTSGDRGKSENRVEVVGLFGPYEATLDEVLRHLVQRSYDVLHFAGHCVFDRKRPSASGWIFSNGERLTANELDRIDRIPKFVFSNACESGITPDRSGSRSVELAPSFAEAFFARGVSNFVCTAWPVDDGAARHFALTLYQGLLGLEPVPGQPNTYASKTPMHMHRAMRDARRAVAAQPRGYRTWGAYQHYGSPYLRFFEPSSPAERRRSAKTNRDAIGVSPTAGG